MGPSHLLLRGRRSRALGWPVGVTALAVTGIGAGWPLLVAAPIVGGPLVALAVGMAAWTTARAIAPPPHANDNVPRLPSPRTLLHGKSPANRTGAQTMLGARGKTEPRRAGGLSVIGADVTVTGNVATDGDLHVDGTIEGDVRCGSLVQGASGRIVGTIVAKSARIAGTIEGRVSADMLTIEKAARLRGDADYRSLQIENGAQVDGRMTHTQGDGHDTPLRLVDGSGALG